jgi:hypothetical protein
LSPGDGEAPRGTSGYPGASSRWDKGAVSRAVGTGNGPLQGLAVRRPIGDHYWVLASSETEARRLIRMNPAYRAEDRQLFGCELDDTRTPRADVIHCSRDGPISIERRPPTADNPS